MEKDHILEKLAVLVPDNGNENYQNIVGYVVDKVLSDVTNYVHVAISELPTELEMTVVGLCVQYIETHQLLTPIDEQSGGVDSISEGDTSIKFKSMASVYAELQATNALTDDYMAQLNGFRRVLK